MDVGYDLRVLQNLSIPTHKLRSEVDDRAILCAICPWPAQAATNHLLIQLWAECGPDHEETIRLR